MEDSILKSTKKLLNIPDDYEHFDQDVLVHINSAFGTLQQLGVGPEFGFYVTDETQLWSEFTNELRTLNPVRTYVYLRVRMLFDPPQTSYLLESMKKQVEELEWRLNIAVDGENPPYRFAIDGGDAEAPLPGSSYDGGNAQGG